MQSDAGTILIQGGILTEEQLKQALRASLEGGLLVQHIVRFGFATDHFLATYFSRVLDIPLLEENQLAYVPAFITRLVPKELVQEHHAIPIMLHQGILYIAMSDPTSRATLEEIAFLTGYSVSPVAASESLMQIAMEKYYGIPAEEISALAPRDAPLLVRSYSSDQNLSTRALEEASGELAELFQIQLERQEIIDLTKPKVVRSAPPNAAVEGFFESADTQGPVSEQGSKEPLEDEAELAPISATEARFLIEKAAERDEVARVLVRFAATLVERVILFQARQDLLVGWLGRGTAALSVRGLMVPLAPASVFRTASETFSDYFGSMPHATVNDTFLQAIGDVHPRQVLLIPILVRHKLIALLYCDCGEAPGFSRNLSDIHLVTELAAAAFEKLILERKVHRRPKS